MGFAEGSEEGAEPTNLDGLCLAVFRDATHKYVHFGTSQPLQAPLSGSAGDASPRLPPILFDLEAEGGAELRNLAAEPEHAALAHSRRPAAGCSRGRATGTAHRTRAPGRPGRPCGALEGRGRGGHRGS